MECLVPSAVCRRAEEDRSEIDLLLLLLLGVVVPDDDFFFLANDVLYSSTGMRITKSSSDIPPIPPPQRFIFLVGRETGLNKPAAIDTFFTIVLIQSVITIEPLSVERYYRDALNE